MITGEIKNKIDKIWETLWTGGITNPLSVIEQLTYLMFIRSLDQKEQELEEMESWGDKVTHIFAKTPTAQAMRWSKFKDLHADTIFATIQSRVFPAIKEMKHGQLPDFDKDGNLVPVVVADKGADDDLESAFSNFMKDAAFIIPNGYVLEKLITGLEDLYEHDLTNVDIQGDLYEHMLSKLTTAGTNGQFRTPKQIREMMVELMAPTADDLICDPACGTAGFLVSAAQYIHRMHGDKMSQEQWNNFYGPMFTGFEIDSTMLRISAMNLMLHSISRPDLRYMDSVSKQNEIKEKFTLCLANPPFKGSVDNEIVSPDLKAVAANAKKTELLFVALFLRMLQKGGRCACIVPDGVLFGSSKGHKAVRKELVENHMLQAVISMPSGVFKPYAGVSTAVLIFTKVGAENSTKKVWFYDMQADGRSLDDKRTPIKENDIPDIIARFHNLEGEEGRARTEKSFFVPKEEIVANDYDLSINKYKQVEYEKVEYPPTSEILAKINQLNVEIAQGLDELGRML